MGAWLQRLTVVFLLLVAGTELLACDVLSPETCEIQTASDHGRNRDTGSDDECLCCCYHVMPVARIGLSVVAIASPSVMVEPRLPRLLRLDSVDHPPRP